ncbi:MAG: Ribosomal large subunit pseudouridine synthase B [Chlamydiales bacterium]|nr:Ribosomal large subunit pseudouridine synthase B [Chlamydiales bacterium]
MKKRLSKALAAAGIASRRASEELIFQRRVSVNGETVTLPQTLVDWERDKIVVDGEKVQGEEKKYHFLFNKPVGYLCTNAPGTKSVVLRFFAHIPGRLYTVGRLDKETSGLILITNDGAFANRVIHPSYNISKEYLAKTSQEITPAHLEALSKGAWVEGVHVKPLMVKKVRRGTVKITVAEGKKHEVRLLLASAKLAVRELKRIRVGPFTLGTLPEGAYRELTESEHSFFQ